MTKDGATSILKLIVVIVISAALVVSLGFIADSLFSVEFEVLGFEIGSKFFGRLLGWVIVWLVIVPYFFSRNRNK